MNIKDRVTITVENHIATVTLDRPDKMNALDIPMFNAIIEAAEVVEKDSSVRVVVLTGAGRAFCAGLDLKNMAGANGVASQPLVVRTHGITNTWQQAVYAWRALSVPVIAAVHGVAFGGGLQIMLGAGIKYIAADTQLSIMEMKWGLVPDMAGTQLMYHSVRDDIIRELTYTNRIFSGEEAVKYGFATHVSESPLADAMKLAEEIASKSPSAVVEAKRLLNEAPYLNVEEGLMLESELQDRIIKKPNQMESVFAGMQKRKGNFKDYR